MKRLVALGVFVISAIVAIPISSVGQVKMAAMLFDQFDETVPVNDIFTKELEDSLKKVKGTPKAELIFIAVSPRNLEKALEIRKRAEKLYSSLGFSNREFYVSHPMLDYWPAITKTQIWLVGRDSQPPYAVSQIQDRCIGGQSNPGIYGMSDIDPRTDRVYYEAQNVDWPLEFVGFKWTAVNAQIESGQGTRKIVVKTNRNDLTEIRLTLEVKYLDNLCLQSRVVNFTTRFRSTSEIY